MQTVAECPGQNERDTNENHDNKARTAPRQAQLLQMATAHWISHIFCVAAKLSLADHLAHGPRSADELSGETSIHAHSLYRPYPEARGTLYGLPHVVRAAPVLINARALADRVSIERGSFFQKVPSGADAYLL